VSFLERLNEVKTALTNLSAEVELVPGRVRVEVAEHIKILQEKAVEIGALVSKEVTDHSTLTEIEAQIEQQMGASKLYSGLSPDDKKKIVDQIVNSLDKVVLTNGLLQEFVLEQLNELPEDKLATEAYSKAELVEMGKAVLPKGTADVVAERRGKEILVEQMKSPTAWQTTVQMAMTSILMDDKRRLAYVKKYYGI
jgi:nitrogen regulatory protein PII-like uncharacterized protein